MAVKIQVKRGTKAGLPALSPGEYGLATDTGELFIGGANGNLQVAVLGSDGKVPAGQLPDYDPAGTASTAVAAHNSAQDAHAALFANYLALSGGTMTGDLNMGSKSISNVKDPVNEKDAATKGFLENAIKNSLQLQAAELPPEGTTLANATWAQIKAVADAGLASEYWAVGDTKDIVVSGETLTMEIVGFDHDDLPNGGKAGITFGTKNLMANERTMNSTNTNVDGFTGTDMYAWLQGELFSSLPSDLQSVIETVNKKTSAGNMSDTINTNAMKIFLFSEVELFGSVIESKIGEGSLYSHFSIASNRVKYSNVSGYVYEWWERSPAAYNAASFCSVSEGGGANASGPTYSMGVCFGFCVGRVGGGVTLPDGTDVTTSLANVLGVNQKAPMYEYGTADLTAGTSALETGKLYFVYE